RNATSRGAKWVLTLFFSGSKARDYQSYCLMLGSVGRGVAAYAGAEVYLDVALGWVAPPAVTAPVTLRDEGDRRSGYSTRRLLSHFWRMVITSGTRGLRFVSLLGGAFAVVGVLVTLYLFVARFAGVPAPEGWA